MKHGFTLIELVVVIAILGILAAILIPVIGGFISRANIARDQANARNLYNSCAIIISTGGTPSAAAGGNLEAFIDLPASGFGWTIDSNGVLQNAWFGTQQYNSGGGFSTHS